MTPLSGIPPIVRYMLAAVAGLALATGIVLWLNQGSHVRLEGRILKVRIIATGDDASLALVDFRVSNPARVPFVVRDVRLAVIHENGERMAGLVSAQSDLDRVLGYFPAEGPRYNEVLRAKFEIPGSSGPQDWCAAAAFPFSAESLARRRGLEIEVEDVDGARALIAETARSR